MQAALQNEELRRKDLEWQIAQLKGKKYSPSSEKLSIEQLELMLEGLSPDKPKPELPERKEEPKKHYQSKKTSFPEDLPIEVINVPVPEKELICPETGRPRELVKYEESFKYDWVKGYFRKTIIKREVRAVKLKDSDPLPTERIITSKMPSDYCVIPGCMAGVSLIAHIMVSKYCDHLPLYRQQSIFKSRHDVHIDRTLMGHWLKQSAKSLKVLYDALLQELIASNYLQIDETFIKLLDPEVKGKAKQAFFWVLKNPKGGMLFKFDPGRSTDVPEGLLEAFVGKLQSDGYTVYETLLTRSKLGINQLTIDLFNCWAHARRKIDESLEANGPDAAWYMAKIGELYAIEDDARSLGYSFQEREQLRMEKAVPVLEEIKEQIDIDQINPAILPASPLGKGLNYIRERWKYLEAYAQSGNGEVEIDNNPVENAIRPTAIGKKNWLFIGHPKAGQMSAIIYTIIENCRMFEIDPYEYLVDVLPKIKDQPSDRISELLPRQWADARQ